MDGLGHDALHFLVSHCQLRIPLLHQLLLGIQLLIKAFIFSLDELLTSIVTIKSFLKPEALASNASTLEVAITTFSSLAKYWEVMCITYPNIWHPKSRNEQLI